MSNPTNEQLDTLRSTAMHWMDMRRSDRAEPVLRSILEIDPVDAFALDMLSRVELEKHAIPEAEELARLLVMYYPTTCLSFIRLCIVLAAKSDHYGAIEAARNAIQLAPDHARPHAILSFAFRNAGQHEEAMLVARQALQLDPFDFDAIATIAVSGVQLGLLEEAYAAARELLRLAPAESFTMNIAGDVFMHLGRGAEGMRLLRKILADSPADYRSHEILGHAYWHRQDFHIARQHYREALKLNPRLENIRKILRMRRTTEDADLPEGWVVQEFFYTQDEWGRNVRMLTGERRAPQ